MPHGPISVCPGLQSSPTRMYRGCISTHQTSSNPPPSGTAFHLNVTTFSYIFLKKSYYTPVPALFTCYKELSTNGHTSQEKSGRGEVSSRGPCSEASGPGLGGGDGGVIEACLSTIFNNRLPAAYDKHLHSVCYKILWLDMTDILQCIIVIAA